MVTGIGRNSIWRFWPISISISVALNFTLTMKCSTEHRFFFSFIPNIPNDQPEPRNCPCLFFSLRKLLRYFNFFICSFVLISFKDTPWVLTKWELASRVVLSANLICLIISWKQDPAKNTKYYKQESLTWSVWTNKRGRRGKSSWCPTRFFQSGLLTISS